MYLLSFPHVPPVFPTNAKKFRLGLTVPFQLYFSLVKAPERSHPSYPSSYHIFAKVPVTSEALADLEGDERYQDCFNRVLNTHKDYIHQASRP